MMVLLLVQMQDQRENKELKNFKEHYWIHHGVLHHILLYQNLIIN